MSRRINFAEEFAQITVEFMDDLETSFLEEVAIEAEEIMKEKIRQVAYASGRMHDSVSAEIYDNYFEVGPTVLYSTYVEKGAGPSRGRFVPDPAYAAALGYKKGIRLTAQSPSQGYHPGRASTPFLQKSFEDVMDTIDRMIQRRLDNLGGEFSE